MSASRGSLADINQANAEFWSRRRQLLQERLANAAICEIAFGTLQSEQFRQIPFLKCLSFEDALHGAEHASRLVLARLARKGGTTRKPDALQGLIETIVTRRRDITLAELIIELHARQSVRDVIQDIDDDSVCFAANDGSKVAPLSGLKDRLSRAKKKIRSR